MKGETAVLILFFAKVKCPLCNEKFRTKYVLRVHIQRHHTEIEAEKLIEREEKRTKKEEKHANIEIR